MLKGTFEGAELWNNVSILRSNRVILDAGNVQDLLAGLAETKQPTGGPED